jgi:2-oxoglutarate ferredoxin oxidoreductase subunit delta
MSEPKVHGGGTAYIKAEYCKGCAICVEFCPPHALELSNEYNKKGYHPPVLTHPELCTGCDLCGLFCPDFAIFGVRFKKSAA